MDQSMEESRQQIEALSKIFGSSDGDDMAGKIAMAKQLSQMLNRKEEEKPAPSVKSRGNKQADILTAALPFIDPSFQRPVSILMNIMEIQHILNRETLQIQSIQPEDGKNRTKQLIQAILPYLNPNEQQTITGVMKIMEMSKMMNLMGGDRSNG